MGFDKLVSRKTTVNFCTGCKFDCEQADITYLLDGSVGSSSKTGYVGSTDH
jgi:hypothetical protein